MGGRGTFAAGKKAAYSYKTVGMIDGVKVLEGISGKHSLPESAHKSRAYIKLRPDGTFHEMRFYNEKHILYMEIAYHPEKSLTGNSYIPILHYHIYGESFSVTKGRFYRSEARLLTQEMKQKYRRFFKGVKSI